MAVAACPDVKSLQRFLLGQLPGPTAETVESHVLSCPRCARVLPTLAADDTLVEAMRARAKSGLPQHEKDLVDGLMMRLQRQRPRPGSDPTATGENTMSHAPAEDDSRALIAFLAPAQAGDELGRLGHYRVLKVLGHGGMGVVFQAEDAHLKRSVAVKAMLPEVAKKSTARERFLREARAAAGLEHDHIVTVHHVGEERGVPFMVMPMLKGSSLEDFIKKKPNLTTGQILKVGREIARGLAAAHEVGLIHRDIKPGNIWLDATAGGRVKILDFGLARSGTDDHITQEGLIVGTAAYMAPEQARGAEVDGRADLFSLGVILYRLCTGQTPWKGSDAVSTLLLAATEPATPISQLNPNVPAPLAELIMQLLAKKPEDRPISARSVADDLAKIERSLKAATVPVATAVQPAVDNAAFQSMTTDSPTVALPNRKVKRRWPWVAVTLLIAACGVALAGVIYVKTDQGTLRIDTSEQVEVVVEQDGKVVRLIDTKGGGEVRLEAGDYRLKLAKPEMFVEVKPDHIVMKRGELVLAQVTRRPDDRPKPTTVPPPPPPPKRLVPGTTVLDKVGEVRRFDGHTDDVRQVIFTPDGKHLVSASKDKTLRLWDVATGQQLKQVAGPTGPQNSLAVAPDGRQVLVGMYSKLLWWDPETGALAAQDFPSANVWASYSPDGRRVAAAVSAPEKQLIFFDPATRKETSRFELELPYSHPTFIGNGKQLLMIRASGPGAIFDAQTGKLVRNMDQWVGTGLRMALSPDERRLITIDSGKRAALGDVVNGTKLRQFPDGIASAAFSPDSRTVLTGEVDGAVVLRDAESGKELHRFLGHTANVASVAFAPDGQTAVSASYDKTIRQWQLPKSGSVAPALDPWTKTVQALPAEKQVEAVAAKLKELNPGFDGKVQHRVERGRVVWLKFASDQVANVSPIRALAGLEDLDMDANAGVVGQLPDLEALRGLALRRLLFARNGKISSLEPLRGMPLERLGCRDCQIRDLGPLQGMPLTTLTIATNPITDLTPLQGMGLTSLAMFSTKVTDLRPLAGMPLAHLDLNNVPVADLTPLRTMPMRHIVVIKPELHLNVLRSLWTLEQINDLKADAFWTKHDPRRSALLQWIEATQKLPAAEQLKAVIAKLQEMNPGFDGSVKKHEIVAGRVVRFDVDAEQLKDISPVRAFADLEALECLSPWGSKRGLADLSPLAGMKLKKLTLQGTAAADLTPLRGMPLDYLNVASTEVTDLTPLAGLPLTELLFHATKVANLTPLKGMALRHAWFNGTAVRDLTPLQGMPLVDLKFWNTPVVDLEPLRNATHLKLLSCNNLELLRRSADILRSIKTLEKVNDQPIAEFWKGLDGAKP